MALAPSSSLSSSSWFQKLQEQFLSGAFTDCIIRVNIVEENDSGDEADEASAAKRQKLDEPTHSKENKKKIEEIAAHAHILSLRSPYFEKALTSGWKEGEKKTIEISLGSTAAVEDLRLLLRLSYTESYVKDGDHVLDIATRMRMAELADALEFRDCVRQCIFSLGEGLTLKTALTIMDEVPEPLLLCYEDEVKELEWKAMKAMMDGIGTLHRRQLYSANLTDEEKALMQEAGEYIVIGLGHVEAFFEEGAIPQCSGFQHALTLKSRIKDLPVSVMEVLLKSDLLHLKTENDVFYLVWAWVCSRVSSGELFLHLVPHLRFHHMSLSYLANVVVHCPYLKATEKLTEIMTAALSHRDAHSTLLAKRGLADVLPKNRAFVPLEEARWTFNFTVNLKELLKLQRGKGNKKHLGLVAGYPIAVFLRWQTEEHGGGFGLYFMLEFPGTPPSQVNAFKRVAPMVIECVLDSKKMGRAFLCEEKNMRGYHDCFPGQKWEEIVFEGSPYFRRDVMKGEARVKVLTKSPK